MAIFNSYVKLPEGTMQTIHLDWTFLNASTTEKLER